MDAATDGGTCTACRLPPLNARTLHHACPSPAPRAAAAPSLTAALQTALLGRCAGATSALAAFAAVGACVGFLQRIFNFLVDGVSSKVGRCVGQRDWNQLGSHVRLSLGWSLAVGAAAVLPLLAARRPALQMLLGLDSETRRAAAAYWTLRCWLLPLQLLNMAALGILQVNDWGWVWVSSLGRVEGSASPTLLLC